ncbi:MAG: histidine phosphatase family protein [Caulobacteraceae bacterium]|nr:histidine phosphatase family protein [Caulobacteraceae bacterium]
MSDKDRAGWPKRLWIVRHGESAGNVARDLARDRKQARIDIAMRDVDVPLSDQGRAQAAALGDWFAALPAKERPDVVLSSPYLRARDTVAAIGAAGGLAHNDVHVRIDERLREREFGILDRLTTRGIRELHPEQWQLRQSLGKFYHRPPGGESWCDVILRLRSLLDTVSVHDGGKDVLVVCHQVVVLCFRYLIEELDEAEILRIDREAEVANCAITEYAFDPDLGRLRRVRYNFVAHMREAGAPVTREPDRSVAAR